LEYNIDITVLETPHVIVGAAIGAKFAHPLISVPLAFGSHFLLDMVPHWNPHLNTETKKHGRPTNRSTLIVAADLLVAFGSVALITSSINPGDNIQLASILGGAAAGIAPDVVEGPYFFLNMKNKLVEKWIMFQKSIQTDTSLIPGIATQIITVLAAVWWIFS